MRTRTKFVRLIVVLSLLYSFLLLSGCGRDVANSQGCPSGAFLANSTDIISGPADVAYTGNSSYGAPFPGGTVVLTPVIFTVTDSSGMPRNNVCLTLYTGDTAAGPGPFWYTDSNYNVLYYGTGPFNYRTVGTNDVGEAILYWSTADLPPANLATSSTGTTGTYTAGADQTGTSFIKVYSGTRSAIFNVNWTVKGEPAPTS